eukprot:CAMPEP_0182509702 /NCGR_PEP_ID=MMETSP1321-20130603/27346_1 /TAXON_ID=91990 /ORGANISM="Bolidomonas sp., Strain RCC1657" /LENGTH=243 /DNA_ID=CAMNT_0024716041 /DNA_START=1028 /DNA_END=1756 /DNA_ORIENTATION=-
MMGGGEGLLNDGVPYTNENLEESVDLEEEVEYICWEKSVAGIGLLTDHGKKLHGWNKEDYEYSYNIGKGGLMKEFRDFASGNIGLDYNSKVPGSDDKIRITFSTMSSASPARRLTFKKQIQNVKELYANDASVIIEEYNFADLDAKQQVEIHMKTNVMVTAAGGGAVTSMFLPDGAALILYYDSLGTNGNTKRPIGHPARLDWDYFNNMAYVRTSWLPIVGMDDDALEVFTGIVEMEVENYKS